MKKIMMIDDSPEVRMVANSLRSDDIKVFLGSSLYDADGYLFDDNIDFDLMIIDFALGNYEFKDDRYKSEFESLGNKKAFLIGWIWIKQYIASNKASANHIIGLSAYIDLLNEDDIIASGIHTIDKQDRDSVKLLREMVKDLLK